MGWFHNLISRPGKAPDAAAHARLPSGSSNPLPSLPRPSQDVEAAIRQRVRYSGPTDDFTPHQFFYIFILDGLGAMILSGGINFVIAYAMYTSQDTVAHPIRLFQLPNTLAGDCAVTIIVQSIITWVIEYFLVKRDVRTGGVQPIGFLAEPTHPLLRRLFFLDGFTSGAEPGRARHWPVFALEQVARAMLAAFVTFLVFWGPSVGILTTVGTRSGGDWVYEKTWVPQVFKLLLGGLLSLVQTPLFAIFWLAREGWVTGAIGITDANDVEDGGLRLDD